ncbi:MAG TPA: TauD/TfdA family dioxygenase [Acidimicrobiales bacterium]
MLPLPDLEAGIVPERTDDPVAAAHLMAEAGACILTGLPTGQASAAVLARKLLGDRVVADPEPVMVREGGDKDPKIRDEAAHEVPLPLHVDGFTFGHECPDVMILLCDRDSAEGGESVLVDDLRVLDALAAEPAGSAGARLHAFMTATELDLTTPGMVRRSGTLVGTSAAGRRLLWLGALPGSPSPPADDPDPDGTRRLVAEVNELFESFRLRAPRFRLGPGEAVCVDNYRVSHSRDAYVDLDRLFWRVWAWTDEAIGVPEGRLASDVRYADA